MRLSVWTALLAVALSFWLGMGKAAAGPRAESVTDFMIMDVCVDAQDRPIPNVTPINAGCTHRRKIRPGEPVPYHMHNFPATGSACKFRLGTVAKDSIPIEKNGVTRFAIYYDKGVDHSCPGVQPQEPAFGRLDPNEGGSVLWSDADYGFWLGSWSPIATSTFKSPLCQPGVHSSRQFFRGRILGPTEVPSTLGVAGFGIFDSNLVTGAPGQSVDQCPTRYNRHITTWVRDRYSFRSGVNLDTIISSHYTKADQAGTGLGESMQMERTYWTKEFGFTRWEKWAREDWVHPRSGKTVEDLAATLFTKGTCGKPYSMPASVSPTLGFDPVSDDGSYSETIRDPTTGETHRWYVSLCEDYTNVIKDSISGTPPQWAKQIDDTYWLR